MRLLQLHQQQWELLTQHAQQQLEAQLAPFLDERQELAQRLECQQQQLQREQCVQEVLLEARGERLRQKQQQAQQKAQQQAQ